MSLPRYFEDPQTLHVNTTPHHAYFIPFSSAESAVKKTREFSPYFTLLNGEWDFSYFESYTHLPQDFLHFSFTHVFTSLNLVVNILFGVPFFFQGKT